MALVDEVRAANEEYAGGFTKGDLPMPPGRKFAVVACMDARLDPAKALGLEEGDAHVIRNAGGRAAERVAVMWRKAPWWSHRFPTPARYPWRSTKPA